MPHNSMIICNDNNFKNITKKVNNYKLVLVVFNFKICYVSNHYEISKKITF